MGRRRTTAAEEAAAAALVVLAFVGLWEVLKFIAKAIAWLFNRVFRRPAKVLDQIPKWHCTHRFCIKAADGRTAIHDVMMEPVDEGLQKRILIFTAAEWDGACGLLLMASIQGRDVSRDDEILSCLSSQRREWTLEDQRLDAEAENVQGTLHFQGVSQGVYEEREGVTITIEGPGAEFTTRPESKMPGSLPGGALPPELAGHLRATAPATQRSEGDKTEVVPAARVVAPEAKTPGKFEGPAEPAARDRFELIEID